MAKTAGQASGHPLSAAERYKRLVAEVGFAEDGVKSAKVQVTAARRRLREFEHKCDRIALFLVQETRLDAMAREQTMTDQELLQMARAKARTDTERLALKLYPNAIARQLKRRKKSQKRLV
jgi:capsule polysaccharide export protein KpsE/RkpR